jgi:hypothetical protein
MEFNRKDFNESTKILTQIKTTAKRFGAIGVLGEL